MEIHPQTESVITIELIAKIKAQYCLEWFGTHGVIHWSRVYELPKRPFGLLLAEEE